MTLRPMPTVLLYDPAVSSLNIGDHIISDSCDRVLAPLLAESWVVRVSSHLSRSPATCRTLAMSTTASCAGATCCVAA